MSYEPTNWKTGDVVTSAKLNKLENAVVSGGPLKLNFILDKEAGTVTIDRTYAEIKEAILSGSNVFGIYQVGITSKIAYPNSFEESTDPSDKYYAVYIRGLDSSSKVFYADTENDYPVCDIKNS